MESLPARKPKPSLEVERLEDRQLLSFFGPAPADSTFARPIDFPVETAPVPASARMSSEVPAQSGRADWSSIVGSDPSGPGSPETAVVTDPTTTDCGPTPTVTPAVVVVPGGSNEIAPGALFSAESADPTPRASSIDNPPANSTGQEARGAIAPAAPSAPEILAFSAPTRLASANPVVRSVTESVVQPTSRVDVSSDRSEPAHSSVDPSLLAVAVAVPASPAVTPLADPGRGAVAINLPSGPGSTGGLALSGQAPTPAPDPSVPVAPGALAIGASGEPGSALISSDVGSLAESQADGPIGIPEPDLAGMIQQFLPLDRTLVDQAIDRLLEPFEGLTSSLPELRGPMGLITASLAAAATVVAVEVAIRLRKSRDEASGDPELEGLGSFPCR